MGRVRRRPGSSSPAIRWHPGGDGTPRASLGPRTADSGPSPSAVASRTSGGGSRPARPARRVRRRLLASPPTRSTRPSRSTISRCATAREPEVMGHHDHRRDPRGRLLADRTVARVALRLVVARGRLVEHERRARAPRGRRDREPPPSASRAGTGGPRVTPVEAEPAPPRPGPAASISAPGRPMFRGPAPAPRDRRREELVVRILEHEPDAARASRRRIAPSGCPSGEERTRQTASAARRPASRASTCRSRSRRPARRSRPGNTRARRVDGVSVRARIAVRHAPSPSAATDWSRSPPGSGEGTRTPSCTTWSSRQRPPPHRPSPAGSTRPARAARMPTVTAGTGHRPDRAPSANTSTGGPSATSRPCRGRSAGRRLGQEVDIFASRRSPRLPARRRAPTASPSDERALPGRGAPPDRRGGAARGRRTRARDREPLLLATGEGQRVRASSQRGEADPLERRPGRAAASPPPASRDTRGRTPPPPRR